jgi:hypothetical protein
MAKRALRSDAYPNLAGEFVSDRYPVCVALLYLETASLARIIVYSMAPDGPPAPNSTAPTPYFTPLPSGMNTPQIHTTTLGEYLSAPLGKTYSNGKTYLASSKALDSLARLIASTASFFHPSNSGAWTADVCILSTKSTSCVTQLTWLKTLRCKLTDDCVTPIVFS